MPRRRQTISYSEVDAFRQCPLKHHLAYVTRWQRVETSPALARGTVWHSMLEAVHRSWIGVAPKHRDARAADVLAQEVLRDSRLPDEEIDLLCWMWQGYQQRYGVDPEYDVIEVEVRRDIPLRHPDTGRPTQFRFKTKIDRIVRLRRNGSLWLVDNKTGKNLPTKKDLQLEDQFTLYEWQLAQTGVDVVGTIVDFARTQRNKGPMAPEDRFDRQMLSHGVQERFEVMADVFWAARRMLSADNLAHPYSAPNPEQCRWKCDFKEPHVAARKGMDIHDILSSTGFVRNPERH